MRNIVFVFLSAVIVGGCSPAHRIAHWTHKTFETGALAQAHTGISIFETASQRYWYNYQGQKYFVPASTVKLATCYAAMKYLGKTLPGLKYTVSGDSMFIFPTGDPTFLHPGFERQRVYDFLKNSDKKIFLSFSAWKDQRWGSGWAWDDYQEAYMAERSAMPVYGNVVAFNPMPDGWQIVPNYFSAVSKTDSVAHNNVTVQRDFTANNFSVTAGTPNEAAKVPFLTDTSRIIFQLLADTLHKRIYKSDPTSLLPKNVAVLHSQPTDSLLRLMMHRSDNFLAEQALLMVSNERLGSMNDHQVIDTLLQTDFKNMPQKPRWVDGSGLSRYNLFTPQDFVFLLNKMNREFGVERLKTILPTGNEGSLTHYYLTDSGYIFAKTGSMSGIVSLCGLLYTRKNKLLLFSIVVNNHQASATEVRRSIEHFLQQVRKRF